MLFNWNSVSSKPDKNSPNLVNRPNSVGIVPDNLLSAKANQPMKIKRRNRISTNKRVFNRIHGDKSLLKFVNLPISLMIVPVNIFVPRFKKSVEKNGEIMYG